MALTKLVFSGTPDSVTCAPLTKLLPVTVRVKLPALTSDGLTLLKIDVGLSRATAALALAAVLMDRARTCQVADRPQAEHEPVTACPIPR